MLLQVGRSLELPLTAITRVRGLSSVKPLVSLQVIFGSEVSAANHALILLGLLSVGGPQVFLQVESSFRNKSTNITFSFSLLAEFMYFSPVLIQQSAG